jgi:hypothetical protein
MKKLLISLSLLFMLTTTQAQSIEEILHLHEAATGGLPALEKIRTVQFNSVVTVSFMGNPININVTNIKVNSRLYRREVQGMMGMKNSYSVLTDTSGYLFTAAAPSFGDSPGQPATINKMSGEDVTSAQYQLDCAGAFGHLINYITKGHKAELLGKTKVNQTECYKIKMTLKTGQQIVYYISTKNYLVMQSEAIGKVALEQLGLSSMMQMMGSSKANSMKVTTTYSDYKAINGVQFPTKEKYEIGAIEISMENNDIKTNEPVDAKWFKVG